MKRFIEVNEDLYLRIVDGVECGECSSVIIKETNSLGEVEVRLHEIQPLIEALAEAAGEIAEAATSEVGA